jgi:uncharacterized protein YgfB (UPF0149 family)
LLVSSFGVGNFTWLFATMFQKVPAPDRLTRKVKTVLARTSHRLAALGSVFVLLLPHDEGIHTNAEMATR